MQKPVRGRDATLIESVRTPIVNAMRREGQRERQEEGRRRRQDRGRETESGVLLTHRKSWIHELGLAKDTDTRLYVGTQRSKIDPVGCGEWPAMTMTLALGVVANDDGVF